MLPVLGSGNSLETKYALYMFDSGSHAYDENGNDVGYDSVTPDQIEWYKDTSNLLKKTAGKTVNGLAFQHIIVGEIYDALFHESAVDLGELGRAFNGKYYSFLPKTENVNGFLFELPCPGYYNHGQFDAMVAQEDIKGIFSGHDHTNTFDVEHKGIRIINTPGTTYHSYGTDFTRGVRMITVKENDTTTFDTEVITYNDLALADSDFAQAVEINGFVAAITGAFGDLLIALAKCTALFSTVLSSILG